MNEMDSLDETLRPLALKISEGGGTVFFTGAGISTESGIPDFRSPGGSGPPTGPSCSTIS